jgi:hypothetical protein
MKKQILVLVLVMSCRPLWGLGIVMRFMDVTLENIQPGDSINLRVSKNLPLVVLNPDQTGGGTDILIESLIPTPKETKPGYEPIPDPTWLKIVPDRYHLGPKASASSDMIVAIPNDPKLIGHHYEAILWAHTYVKNRLASTGVVFQTGLRARVRMSIGTVGPAELQREKMLKKLASINVDFAVAPESIFLQNFPLGKWVDLKSERKASFKIINQADDPVELRLTPAPPDPNINPQAGYEYAPDSTWVEVQPRDTKVPGNSIKEVKLRLMIPDKPENRGKHYMFLIRTTLTDESLPLDYNNLLYISTLP